MTQRNGTTKTRRAGKGHSLTLSQELRQEIAITLLPLPQKLVNYFKTR